MKHHFWTLYQTALLMSKPECVGWREWLKAIGLADKVKLEAAQMKYVRELKKQHR